MNDLWNIVPQIYQSRNNVEEKKLEIEMNIEAVRVEPANELHSDEKTILTVRECIPNHRNQSDSSGYLRHVERQDYAVMSGVHARNRQRR